MTNIDIAIGFLLITIGVLIGTLLGLWLAEKLFFTDRRQHNND